MPEQTGQSKTYHFDLFADYFQFYLQDEPIAPEPDATIWTDQTLADMLASRPGIIYIGTVRNMDVRVTVEIADVPPTDNFDGWDQVVDASIDVPSGRIVIAGCTEYFPDAAQIPVTPGTYRIRAYYGALDSVEKIMGLEGDDHYRIILWPGIAQRPHVLKRWVSSRTYDAMTENPLIGTWRLASYQCKEVNGQATFPFGERPSGFMVYGSQGYMSLVVAADKQQSISLQTHKPDRSIEHEAAQVGLLAYSGRYDFTGPNVEHHVDVSSLPNWVGTLLTYSVSFNRADGKQRVNHFARPDVDGTKKQFAWWTWVRVESIDHIS